MLLLRTLCCLVLLGVAGCATSGVHRDASPPSDPSGVTAHTVLLAGGLDRLGDPATLQALGDDARAAGPQSTVVINGLAPAPGERDPVPEIAAALAGYPGRVIVVPGVHDQAARVALPTRVARLSAALGRDVTLPVGPGERLAEIKLTDTFRLLVIDTAWWIADGTGDVTRSDVADHLEQLVADRDDEQLLIVGHHPLYSNGVAGGYGSVFDGVRTLGVGPLLAQTVGTRRHDLAAPTYRQMRRAFLGAFGEHERLTYAAALDGSMQVFQRPVNAGRIRQTFLIGGSTGGTTEPTVAGRGARLAAARAGWWRLRYATDGTFRAEAARPPQAPLWSAELSPPEPELVDDRLPTASDPGPPAPATVTQASDAGFAVGSIQTSALARTLAGDAYRDAWTAPVTVPVLDLGAYGGGLTPVRRGGGNQTTSLRFRGADGYKYDLRLVEKGGSGGLPTVLVDGLGGELVRDLRATVIPYGATVASVLTRAAGLSTPLAEFVFVPDDPRLGRYRAEFGGRLALIEIQPDDDMSDLPAWTGVTDVVSGQKLREEMRQHQDHRVDQAAYLRARLVDLLIADWDRHAGQWRWAAYEPGDLDASLRGRDARAGKVYVPIPGDRDWSFYNPGGLAQRALFLGNRRHQPFGESYGSLTGLTNSGRFQDRRFLNQLSADSVRAIALDLRARLTDEVIERAIATLPPAVGAEIADDWRRALRARRDDLPKVADRLFDFVSRDVDVVGSDEAEWFVASPAPGGLTVEVYADDDGARGRRLYRRTFRADETREVRLFGLGDADRFDLRADGSGIRVRTIGGADRDVVAGDRAVYVYDTPDGVQLDGAARASLGTTPDIGHYDEHAPYRSVRIVSPVLGANATDGVVLGASVTTTTQRFRLHPFAARHAFSADIATGTGGLRAAYAGRLNRRSGPSLALDLLAASPRVARNFYGLGNGTPDAPNDAAQLSVARLEATARLIAHPGPGLSVSAGPTVRYADPSQDDERLEGPLTALPDDAFGAQTHVGGTARLDLTTADAGVNPRQGARFGAFATGLAGASGPAEAYGALGADLAVYLPVRLQPQITLALRGGAEHRLGTPPLFDAATLGQRGGLRGFRSERFTGTTAASATAELRALVGTVDTYLAPLDLGLIAFADGGRVWSRDGALSGAPGLRALDASTVHIGAGGGVWLGVLDRAMLVATVQRSADDTLVGLGLGFDF